MRPALRDSILARSLSTQTTSLPRSAKTAPVTSPTYPVPTTQMFMTDDVPPRLAGVCRAREGMACLPGSLDGHTFREVARLVDVAAPENGHVIRQQLKGKNADEC